MRRLGECHDRLPERACALERLDCYDLILAPVQEQGFDGSRVKATYQGESWTRAMEQEKRRTDNSTVLLLTQRPGERPTVIITTPAIGSLPPRPVLMFSCVDNITRMQVALTHPRTENDIPVSLCSKAGVSFALVCAGKRHAAGIQPGPARD
jgi:type VI secretion system protein VasI